MKRLDIGAWSLWDWIGAICLALAAAITALNAALKDAPAIASSFPDFLSSTLWAYVPLALLLVTIAVVVSRRRRGTGAVEVSKALRPSLATQIYASFDPPSDFRLLPQHYSVDLTATLPYVELRFFVVSYLSQPIVLTSVKLSLRLSGSPALEAIPLVQDDLQVFPKSAPIVVLRRNLTDMEIRNLPWRAGWDTGSFELVAKATVGERTITYGPIGSHVIEGWIRKPPPIEEASRPSKRT